MAMTARENRNLLKTSKDCLNQVDLRTVPKDLRDEVRDLRTRTATVERRLTETIVAQDKKEKK